MSDDNNLNAMLQKISPSLSKGEKALSCGTFVSKASGLDGSFAEDFSDIANRNYLIGVTTNKRLIILPLERSTGMPIKEDGFFVSLSDIKIVDDGFLIIKPGNDKPSKFFYVYGYKVNKEQFSIFFPGFIEAVEQGIKNA